MVDRVRDHVLRHRITGALSGHQRIAVVSLTGGSGRTTVALGLGDVLASERREPVVVLDAVPYRGSLAGLAGGGRPPVNVMDLLAKHGAYAHGAPPPAFRRASGLAVLPSESRPDARYVLGADGYRWLAEQLLPQHFAITVTDTAAALTDPLSASVLSLADLVVVTTTATADSASAAHDALLWMIRAGFGRLSRRAVLVLNAVREGDPGVPLDTLSSYFGPKVGAVVTVPWDRHLASGGPIDTAALDPGTRTAYMTLGAATVAALTRTK
ncbi:MinD/ParA family protein [Kitasatospora sp. NPDC057541]|uniref:MinD/ParA family ATP-binding protein n=1 Tax=unclassified Kitasatospora TaxID=2633591 RepID=UPI0036855918